MSSEDIGAAALDVSPGDVDREFSALESEAGPLESAASDDAIGAFIAAEEAEAAAAAAHAAGVAEYQELLAQLLGPCAAILAPAWGIQSSEIDALSGAWAGVLQKYWPEGPGAFGPEVAALLLTVGIIGPRWRMPRQIVDESPGEVRADPAPAANDDAPVSVDRVAGLDG